MKLCLGFMSSSRVANEEQHHHHEDNYKTSDKDSHCTTTSLTVWRKSLVISCKGFTVIDSSGDLVYRVDNYCERPHEVMLMDGSGKSIFTINRSKKLRLVDKWLVYKGEANSCTSRNEPLRQPIWSVTKHVKILHANSSVLAYVYRGTSDRRYAYSIEGSYLHRSCKVLDESRKVVAEIKKKKAMIGGISFGADVFCLVVQPGFDPDFAMALVLLLDQMFS